MYTNLDKLLETKHMFEWLSENPFEEITTTVEKMFIKQSSSTKLMRFEVVSNPQWLTGGRETEKSKMILVRTAVAFSCNFTLQNNDGIFDLQGVFTWVGANLDSKPITNIWMDIDGTLEQFGEDGLLKSRIYELDS